MNTEQPQPTTEAAGGASDVERVVRRLADVLDDMFKIAPDLIEPLGRVRASLSYAAPEMEPYWWREAATILNACTLERPERKRLRELFAGVPNKV